MELGSGFDIENAPIYNENGINFYLIPTGTMLFRSDSDPRIGDKMVLTRPYDFFGFSQESVEGIYGVAYKFTTKRDLKMIALDNNMDTYFYKNIPVVYKKILDENYGYTNNNIRFSDPDKDDQLSNYIYREYDGIFDGYACKQMRLSLLDPTRTFHSEAMICDKTHIKLDGGFRATQDPAFIDSAVDAWYDRKNRPPGKTKPLLQTESPPSSDYSPSYITSKPDPYYSYQDYTTPTKENKYNSPSEDINFDNYQFTTPPRGGVIRSVFKIGKSKTKRKIVKKTSKHENPSKSKKSKKRSKRRIR